MNPSHVDVDIDTIMVPCTAKDLKATFGWLLIEMRAVAQLLRPHERDMLRIIMSHAGGILTVRNVFPQFKREGEEHLTLRRLRAGQFVRPAKTGRWELNEPIEVTPFARMMWDRIGEGRIFSPPPPVKPRTTSVAARTPPPQAAPVTWDNLLECIQERQKSRATGTNP